MAVSTADKNRENRLRRYLKILGYVLKKSRTRTISDENRGGYQIREDLILYIVAGLHYELTLDDVERFFIEMALEIIKENPPEYYRSSEYAE